MNSLELFAGVGGLALGLHQAGFEPKALIEWNKDACRSIVAYGAANWNVIQADARSVKFSDFKPVHLVSGGPPCQPFSLGGKHKAFNDKRDMFPEAVRAVKDLQPQAFVFENVKGLLRETFRPYFSYILLQLAHPELEAKDGEDWICHNKRLSEHHSGALISGLDYDVSFSLLNAADYGVPQMRNRVMIIGFRKDLGIKWSFPEPTHSKEKLAYAKHVDGSYWDEHGISGKETPTLHGQLELPQQSKERWRTVRDALSGLPDPQSGNIYVVPNHEYRIGAKEYPGHSGSVLDQPSKTIKAGVHGVPGGENMIALDDGTKRYYTVRESARIQTFPDDFVFQGSWTECMHQIGNAVPVKLAYVIGKAIAEKLENAGAGKT
ncbi:MAG: DNA cytosine methyltransferase [Clostridiales bacterium]|jgi:DNA (cytosine-5)-methyltransferase 1|nr:DNA cytosine methyltransferase [Clostridiales bacterium]